MMIYTTIYHSPFGDLILGDCQGSLCLCDWCVEGREGIRRRVAKSLHSNYVPGHTALLSKAAAQLDMYFEHKLRVFDLPIRTCGTEFQIHVWQMLMQIPYAHTLTYSALATLMGRPMAVRAVASAAKANAISIIIPCHRLIGVNSLTGYAGGLTAKKSLIDLEISTN